MRKNDTFYASNLFSTQCTFDALQALKQPCLQQLEPKTWLFVKLFFGLTKKNCQFIQIIINFVFLRSFDLTNQNCDSKILYFCEFIMRTLGILDVKSL